MIGEELKANRKLKGWTQLELAQRIGVSKNTVINYEKGKTIPESKNKILESVFYPNTDENYSLVDKLNVLSPDLKRMAEAEDSPSQFILEQVLTKFHPAEVIDYLDSNREVYLTLEEFRLLAKSIVGISEIQSLKEEIKKINQRLDKFPND